MKNDTFHPRRAVSFLSLLLLSLLSLISCETLVNTIPESKLPKTSSQLTLFSFISPQDTVIRVRVGQTSPIFSENAGNMAWGYQIIDGDTIFLVPSDILTQATVTISDGAHSVQLPYRTSTQAYEVPIADFPVSAGKTYTLTVTDGTRTAQASCTIPTSQAPIGEYTLDTVKSNFFGQRDTTLRLRFSWNDPLGQTNYYRVRAFELYEYSVVSVNANELFLVEKRRRERFYFSWQGADGRTVFQSDRNLDGTTLSSPLGEKKVENEQVFQQLSGNSVVPERGPELLGLYLQLLNTDEHYFLYHRSLQQARQDNPFSEPALVYTNVRGGLGVFAAYNTSLKIIRP